MSETIRCPNCGTEYGIGQFPFCRGNPKDHGKPALDAPFQPYHCHSTGQFFRFRDDRRRYFKAHGLEGVGSDRNWQDKALAGRTPHDTSMLGVR